MKKTLITTFVLTGLLMFSLGMTQSLRASLTEQGATTIELGAQLDVTTSEHALIEAPASLHGAAPVYTDGRSGLLLVFGAMLMFVLFGLHVAMMRKEPAEQPVRVHGKKRAKTARSMMVYWVEKKIS